MKTKFDVTFNTTIADLECMGRHSLSNIKKELPELVESFDVLKTWEAEFEHRFGSLHQLIHHSNPDDPPDVVAHFEQGILGIEHTEIEPTHVKQGEAVHRKERGSKGHCEMPLSGSGTYTSNDIKEIMWGRADPRGWEEVGVHFQTRCDLITSAIQKKICKYPVGGLLVMKGSLGGWPNEFEDELNVIDHAFGVATSMPGISKWIVAVHKRWSAQKVFSVIWIPGLGYKCNAAEQ